MARGISRKKLISKFKNLSFGGPYSGGRHFFMIKGELKVHIPNPHGEDVSASLVSEILRQAGISTKDWNKA